jgi:transposase
MAKRNVVSHIRKATRRKFSAEEKIRIVPDGLRGEIPVSELCRRKKIASTFYHRWSKEFLEAGKNGLTRETRRDATGDGRPCSRVGTAWRARRWRRDWRD